MPVLRLDDDKQRIRFRLSFDDFRVKIKLLGSHRRWPHYKSPDRCHSNWISDDATGQNSKRRPKKSNWLQTHSFSLGSIQNFSKQKSRIYLLSSFCGPWSVTGILKSKIFSCRNTHYFGQLFDAIVTYLYMFRVDHQSAWLNRHHNVEVVRHVYFWLFSMAKIELLEDDKIAWSRYSNFLNEKNRTQLKYRNNA